MLAVDLFEEPHGGAGAVDVQKSGRLEERERGVSVGRAARLAGGFLAFMRVPGAGVFGVGRATLALLIFRSCRVRVMGRAPACSSTRGALLPFSASRRSPPTDRS